MQWIHGVNSKDIERLKFAKTKFNIAYLLDHILVNSMYVKSVDYLTKQELQIRKNEVIKEFENEL